MDQSFILFAKEAKKHTGVEKVGSLPFSGLTASFLSSGVHDSTFDSRINVDNKCSKICCITHCPSERGAQNVKENAMVRSSSHGPLSRRTGLLTAHSARSCHMQPIVLENTGFPECLSRSFICRLWLDLALP